MDPAFITALATLITAIAALVKVLHVEKISASNGQKLDKVDLQTNGNLSALQASNERLAGSQATSQELAAREHKPGP